jgi:hypothetical protein
MANRHSHKKLRAEARARMGRTGESYQQARQRLLALQGPRAASAEVVSGLDLLEFSHFGKPAVLASWHSYGVPIVMVISEVMQRPLMLPRFTMPSVNARRMESGK